MPIDYRIDAGRRLVVATPAGTLTADDLFNYQKEVWSRPDVAGFNELVDMRQVDKIEFESRERARDLASLSAGMDPPGASAKFAILAESDVHFGLGRMYQSFRELNPRSTREVRVFRSMEEALAWLGVDSL